MAQTVGSFSDAMKAAYAGAAIDIRRQMYGDVGIIDIYTKGTTMNANMTPDELREQAAKIEAAEASREAARVEAERVAADRKRRASGMTFADDIEAAANGPIESCIIGDEGLGRYAADPEDPRAEPVTTGELLHWSEARPMLDYKYDRGYGGADCHAITAWTSSRVLFVAEYDGSTRVVWVPRNPSVISPEMV